jgi:hypothetical protein
MVKMTLLVTLCILFPVSGAVAETGPLLEKEVFLAPDGVGIQGYAEYHYDGEGNLVKIETYNGNGSRQSTSIATYQDGLLTEVSYYGMTLDSRLHYSTFTYGNGLYPVKKMDFNAAGMLIMEHRYVTGKGDLLTSIVDTIPGGSSPGYREFLYDNRRLIEDNLYDDSGSLLVRKKIEWKEGLPKTVHVYMKGSRLVRIINRQFSTAKTGTLSPFFLPVSWHDYR